MSSSGDDNRDATLIFFGICTWDYLTSLWFEHKLITKKIRFRWPFVPYFLARYCVLGLVIASILDVVGGDSPTSPPTCPRAVLENMTLHLGLLALVFGTWNLITRTLIIWGHHLLLMRILSAVGLIHFVLAVVIPSVGRSPCTPGSPNVLNLTVFAAITAVIEFAILLLGLVGIRRASLHGDSHLARLLKTQGIAYFVMAFLIQVTVIALGIARTDAPTRMWVGVSGSILSPILSCRLVTSTLSENSPAPGPQTHRIERFELSAGQMTTCMDIDITKDQSVC